MQIQNFSNMATSASSGDLFTENAKALNKDYYHMQHLPYISNCEGLGAYIPLWKLINYIDNPINSCTIVTPYETIPISMYSPKNATSTNCDLEFQCYYDEDLQQKSILFNKQWFYTGNTKATLFQISVEAITSDPNLLKILQYSDNSNTDFIPVVAKLEKSNISSNYIPRVVELTISYYQVDNLNRKIADISLQFKNLTPYNESALKTFNKNYTFKFHFNAWSWYTCMMKFMFVMPWYIIVLIMVILCLQTIILIINIIARKTANGGIAPKFTPMLSMGKGLYSLIGMIFSLIPFLPPILIIKYSYSNWKFGTFLFDNNFSDNLNMGRTGGCLIFLAIFGIFFCLNFISPNPSIFDKHGK